MIMPPLLWSHTPPTLYPQFGASADVSVESVERRRGRDSGEGLEEDLLDGVGGADMEGQQPDTRMLNTRGGLVFE